MGLSLLLSTNHIVIHSYSPVADFLLVVMCLLALLLIRQTFIKQSRTFRIFKSCFALLFIAAVSNIAFYYADLFSRQNTLLWILRAVYHISLLSLFCLYIAYLKILIVFPKNIGRKYTFLSFAILVVTGVADLASPLTGWGFHQDHYGIWYENILSTPFMVGYLLYLAMILFLALVMDEADSVQHSRPAKPLFRFRYTDVLLMKAEAMEMSKRLPSTLYSRYLHQDIATIPILLQHIFNSI